MHNSLSGPNGLSADRMTAEERLAEVCAILARGLVRLRSRAAEDLARDAVQTRGDGESSLHFPAHQRGHANRTRRRRA